MTPPHPTNLEIADKLRQMADLLELQGANPFRAAAYRRAAESVGAHARDLRALDEEQGSDGLLAIPHVGEGIAAAIHEILSTGRLARLERLRGEFDATRLFQTVPGIGPGLARRIHDTLHLDSLEALEAAAHDGRLAGVSGIGPRRSEAIRASLDHMLARIRRPRMAERSAGLDVGLALDVDEQYRREAESGRLPKIAPRRFNPSGEAWLPILHTERGDWHFTALYSNTARAHELGRTHDWVVIYFYDDDHREGQLTVVTESRGPLAGRRVVRGREADCRAYYDVS